MARRRENQAPSPILDRLIGPRSAGGHAGGGDLGVGMISSDQALRDIRASVRLDLEKLLNTRWSCVAPRDDHDELEYSLINYGIPDFTGAALSDPIEQRQFLRHIERAVRHAEPRLVNPRALLPPGANEDQDRVFRFRISAVLHAPPYSEPVEFESTLEPSSHRFAVTGGHH